MNTNRRNRKLSVEAVAKIKLMLHYKIPGTDIARHFGVEQGTISHIKLGLQWKDVVVDFKKFSAGPCVSCGKLLIDGVDDLIYLVAEDSFLCSAKCERKILEANQ